MCLQECNDLQKRNLAKKKCEKTSCPFSQRSLCGRKKRIIFFSIKYICFTHFTSFLSHSWIYNRYSRNSNIHYRLVSKASFFEGSLRCGVEIKSSHCVAKCYCKPPMTDCRICQCTPVQLALQTISNKWCKPITLCTPSSLASES